MCKIFQHFIILLINSLDLKINLSFTFQAGFQIKH